MDETRNSFSYRGRQYWLDVNAMEVINYSLSYDVSVELACKALNINPMIIDNSVPEWELYVDYVKNNDMWTAEQEKRYIKSKLLNLIDGQNRVGDIIKAMQMLLELRISESYDSVVGIKALKDASLSDLQNMLKNIDK